MKNQPNHFLIETERLIWRHFEVVDADFLIALFNSNGWIENIGDRKIYTKTEAEKYIKEHFIPLYEKYNFGFGVVILKDTNEPIGMCGVTKRDFLEYPDLGFAFLDNFTGKGYAFEIAEAICRNITQSIPTLYLFTNAQNLACLKLAEKLNFKIEKTYYEPTFLAEITILKIDKQ